MIDYDYDYVFKKGDLVQMDNQFNDAHPPMGTYGVVWKTEHTDRGLGDFDQYIWVHWAHDRNRMGQNYTEASLKLAAEA